MCHFSSFFLASFFPPSFSVCTSTINYLTFFPHLHSRKSQNQPFIFLHILSYICFLWWLFRGLQPSVYSYQAVTFCMLGLSSSPTQDPTFGEECLQKTEERWNLHFNQSDFQPKHKVQQGDGSTRLSPSHIQLNLWPSSLDLFFDSFPFLGIKWYTIFKSTSLKSASTTYKLCNLGHISCNSVSSSLENSNSDYLIGLLWQSHVLHAKHRECFLAHHKCSKEVRYSARWGGSCL